LGLLVWGEEWRRRLGRVEWGEGEGEG